MDPISALSVGCNVLSLVGMAINCGNAVKHVYDSKVGLTKTHETVEAQADGLEKVVAVLEEKQFHMEVAEGDEIKKIAARCLETCQKLRHVLNDCKPNKKSRLAAGISVLKALVNRGKIYNLEQELKACRSELHSFIRIATRDDVARILRILEDSGIGESSGIRFGLNKMKGQLRGVDPSMLGGETTFQEALAMVNDGIVLEALHSEVLTKRFHEVAHEHQGTYKWIFSNPEMVFDKEADLKISFPGWLERGSGIFHIVGKPGSGKSTLMKYLCRHGDTDSLLSKWAKDGDRQLLVAKFFFWRIGGSDEQKSLRGLIRGLLYEVLCQVPKLARDIFPEHWKRAPRKARGLGPVQMDERDISMAFDRLVRTVAASTDQAPLLQQFRVCLFIDGLDEFEAASSARINTHGRLAEQLLAWAGNSRGNIKICVSSRIAAPFVDNFSIEQRITLNKLTIQDIERVVRSDLGEHQLFKQLKEKDGKECEKLIKQVVFDANGVFLWVSLLLRDFCQGLENGDCIQLDILKERVASTPAEFDGFLEQILNRIDRVYRHGVYLLLAIALRTGGSAISNEQRDAEYAGFGRLDVYCYRLSAEFNLSTLASYSILWASHKKWKMEADLELKHLSFLDRSSVDYADETAWAAAITARCNGLLEVVDNRTKFMHRCVPEFLEEFFIRNYESHKLDDRKVRAAMSWAYLVEVKHWAAKATEDTAISPMQSIESPKVKGGDVEGPVNSASSDSEAGAARSNSASSLTRLSSPPDNSRPYVSLYRIRQANLGGDGEAIFRLLLSIEKTMQINPSHWPKECDTLTTYDAVREQTWSRLYPSAFIGLFDFVDGTFSQPQRRLNGSTRLFNLAHSTVSALQAYEPTVFSVRMFEILFKNGVTTDTAYPDCFKRGLAGKPSWHEVWLSKGANARVLLRIRYPAEGSSLCRFWAQDARDGSGAIEMVELQREYTESWWCYFHVPTLYQALDHYDGNHQDERAIAVEFRGLVVLMHPRNEREIIELVDEQV